LPLHQTQLENNTSGNHVPSPYKGYGIGFDPQFLPDDFKINMPDEKELQAFEDEMKDWLEDYVLFCGLRDAFGTDDWRSWDKELMERDETALKQWKEKLSDDLKKYTIDQWQLHQAFWDMKKVADELDIQLIGDLPFYLSVRSPLVWAHQKAFQIHTDGSLQFVSGASNTKTAHFGRQIWGHPLYNWQYEQTVISLWEIRLRYLSKLFQVIRFDYITGLFEYGMKDPEHEENDKIATGPGARVFEQLCALSRSHNLSLIAEDSGRNIPAMHECMDRLTIPGIKIFRFALNEKLNIINPHYAEIEKYQHNTVVYSTTHDTETLMGYLLLLSADQKNTLANISQLTYASDDKLFAQNIRNALIKSPAKIVIIPVQDWLLTTDRINLPGTEKEVDDPNWRYKLNVSIEQLPTKLF
jgi:4-alpha-glucanotransferase